MIDKQTKLFLKESNAIENVWDDDSLQQAIYAWEFISKEKELNTSNILKTHKILMLHQKLMPDQKGYFRKEQVWVGSREGRPWVVVPELVKQWAVNANDIVENGKNENTEFLNKTIQENHVKYETIHPFIDGNGRTGRIFMNWQRLKLELPIKVILETEKQEYYKWFKATVS